MSSSRSQVASSSVWWLHCTLQNLIVLVRVILSAVSSILSASPHRSSHSQAELPLVALFLSMVYPPSPDGTSSARTHGTHCGRWTEPLATPTDKQPLLCVLRPD